jgi:hypothetical protein
MSAGLEVRVHLDYACFSGQMCRRMQSFIIIHLSYPFYSLSSVPDSPHSHLLPLNRRNHLPSMPHIPKLQIPYPLPRARVQPPIRNRNRHTRSHQRRFNMCLHHHPLAFLRFSKPIHRSSQLTGISSLPSASCRYSPFLDPLSSGTIRSKASDMSARTSES